MISSLGVYGVMSSYRYFAVMLLGFGGMCSSVELEGFSPDELVLCKWNGKVLG